MDFLFEGEGGREVFFFWGGGGEITYLAPLVVRQITAYGSREIWLKLGLNGVCLRPL